MDYPHSLWLCIFGLRPLTSPEDFYSMTIDINAPEVQEAIAAAVEKATAPLLAKRDELLGEVKQLRKGKQFNPEDVEKLESQIDELKSQLGEAQKIAKTAAKEAESAKKALQDSEGFTQRLLVDNGLNDALAKAGVTNPVHQKAVKAMLAGQVQIVADGDTKVAKVGDKALADYVGEWAKGDEGKFFVAAPANNGGGASGGGTKPAAKQINRAEFDSKNPVQKAEFIRSGGAVTD